MLKTKELALRSIPYQEDIGTIPIPAGKEKLDDYSHTSSSNPIALNTINAAQYTAVALIQKKLMDFFENQSKRMGFTGNRFTFENAQEAQYIMVTLADEIFINIEWEGAQLWQQSTLEARIFFTQVSGELIFKRINELLRLNNQSKKEVGCLYLAAIGLGFKGCYRDNGDLTAIDHYREQLFAFIHHVPANLLYPGREKMFDDPYRFTITNRKITFLPTIRTWFGITGGIILFYLFITFVVWQQLTTQMHHALDQLESKKYNHSTGMA